LPFLLFVRYEVQRALLLDNHHNHNNNYFSNDIFEAREVLIGAMERPLFPFDILKRFGVTDPGSQDRPLVLSQAAHGFGRFFIVSPAFLRYLAQALARKKQFG
jgi:hypothetical protein